MECAELLPAGSSEATMSQQDMKSDTTFSPPFSQTSSPPSPEDKKFLVPVLDAAPNGESGGGDSHSLLSGCALPAWSAVIHRPAEDSEPDELPSTVDMDAIKGSPPTPKVPYSSSEPWGMGGERDASDSSDDESDDDSSGSGSENGDDSGSEADGSVSSSCSWTDEEEDGSSGEHDDSSDDGASSCSSSSSSSASSCSSASRASTATPQQTFSIRETNFDQGGLKLKIAAMTVRPSEDSSKASSVTKEVVPPVVKQVVSTPVQAITISAPSTLDKKPVPQSPMSRLRPRKKEEVKGVASGSQAQRAGPSSKRSQVEAVSHANGPSSSASSRAGQPGGEAAISQLAQELSGDALQEINQEDLAAILPDVSTPEGPNEDVAGPPFDGFEDVSSLSGKADISGAAAHLAASSSTGASQSQAGAESSSEDMELLPEQVVSAAIQRIHLDEDTASCADGADAALQNSRDRVESFSSEDGEDEASDVETKSPRTKAKMYSSRLLQQFEQKTAMLSQGDQQKLHTEQTTSSAANDSSKQETKESKTTVHTNNKHRRPRGRPPKNPIVVEAEEAAVGNKNCSLGELDAFMRLDCCNVSNVSPDSGIQSVAGSPVHQSCSPASNTAVQASPVHSNLPLSTSPAPQQRSSSPPKSSSPLPANLEPKRRGRPSRLSQSQQMVKRRGPGRPKGSVKKNGTNQQIGIGSSPESRPERGTLETELPGFIPSTSPLSSSLNASQQPMKRGPGRPKKNLSALESSGSVSSPPSSKKNNSSGKGEVKCDSKAQSHPETLSETDSKSLEQMFLSRRAKRSHGLKTRNKSNKTKTGKRTKAKFSIDKRKLRKGLSTGKRRWRSNNIKALTVPFHFANDSAYTVAVSHINHKYLSKSQPSGSRKHSSHGSTLGVPSHYKSNHKMQQKSRSSHKLFAHHKLRDQGGIKKSSKSSSARLLAQGKHKKKTIHIVRSNQEDPAFMQQLEELLDSLNKCSISRCLSLPTPGETRLPSIFRVRRLLKRRKGSERSRTSDRESESEAPSSNQPKSPHQTTKEKSKRKTKKSAVEPPKRAEPNEQRLPLKKRHYHLTNQQPSSALDSTGTQEQSSPPAVLSAVATLKSSPPSASALSQPQTPVRSDKSQSTTRNSRNSIDEAIEACISRYSASKLSSCSEKSEDNAKATTPATPKKRHKTEESKSPSDQEKSSSVPVTPPKPSAQATTPPVPQKRTAAIRTCNQISINAQSNSQSAEKTTENSPDIIKVKVETDSMEVQPNHEEHAVKKSKKKSIRDVRVHVTKLNDNDLLLKKAVAAVKKKAKRRKTINRTGFPVKRKKKPKQVALTKTEISSGNGLVKIHSESTSKTTRHSEALSKDIKAEPAKNNRSMSGKRKHEAVLAENSSESPSIPPSVSKRLRGCKDEDTLSTTDEVLPLIPLLSESLFSADVPSGDESSKSGKKKQPPKWRKKFLVAGLFSDYYKEDESKKASTSGEVTKSRSTVYKPEEHIHGLLPPPYHCGKYLRQRRVDFQLPHDLWWLHTHNQLPGRDSVPSWNYKKIRTNVYYDVKAPYTYEAQGCNCTMPHKPNQKACGEDCINRLVYAECSPQLCPCKEKCANQKIQKHDWAPGIEKFMTKDKGWGVRTKKSIKAGEFILEYVGEVVGEKEFKNRMASRYSNDTHHYCLNLDGGLVIDGHRMGGDGRFVNHSCEPNCEMQKWSVNGLFRMALFALRDIDPGEELGYDYNFSLFNPAEGQPCKCGSSNCRGVIGGKSQRVTMLPINDKDGSGGDKKLGGRLNKNSRKSKIKHKKSSKTNDGSSGLKSQVFTPMRPMSHLQRCFAQMHHCFLLRNLEKVKRVRDKLKHHAAGHTEAVPVSCANYGRPAIIATKAADVFLAQLNALSTPRSMRTRRLAQAEDNPELTRVARLAYVFKDLYQIVCSAKDEKEELLSTPFMLLPAKKKLPLYYERIQEPIDLTMIEKNITSGLYKTVETFDQDFCRLFNNNVRFYGRTSELGIVAARLRKIYSDAKVSFQIQLEDILGESPPASFLSDKNNVTGTVGKPGTQGIEGEEEEEIIRCICGLYMDEGLMIQCERCLVWQHSDCVKADSSVEHYLCEQCVPRQVNRDILMNPQPDYATPGQIYYISLMREDLQLRQGDTVYVLRDIVREDITDPNLPPQKHTYKTLRNAKPEDCDIFRIERLSIDEKGNRFAFGHHYLRPHETYHEPTRRFFPNEVMRVPLYEVVPFDLVLGQCWVLDVPTFCKGRPIGAKEEHVYVCEFRVDKTAHLFTRLAPRTAKQSVAQLCTKPYAFEVFHTRLKPQRTYTPHGASNVSAPRPRSKSRHNGDDDACSSKSDASKTHSQQRPTVRTVVIPPQQPPAVRRAKQKDRLNEVLLNLLAKQQCKQPLDVSYLLEPNRRQRKKPAALLSS